MSLKSGGEAHRLEHQAGVDFVVLRKNFFSGKPQLLLLRSSADYMRPTHIIEKNFLCLKSSDYKYQAICKISSQQHLDYYLTKQLHTIAY